MPPFRLYSRLSWHHSTGVGAPIRDPRPLSSTRCPKRFVKRPKMSSTIEFRGCRFRPSGRMAASSTVTGYSAGSKAYDPLVYTSLIFAQRIADRGDVPPGIVKCRMRDERALGLYGNDPS